LTQLLLTISPDRDAEQMEQSTRQLRHELSELADVNSVDLAAAGEAPDRAKAGDPIAWGQLLLTLAASGGVLTTLVATAQTWLGTREHQTITVEIGGDKLQVTGIPSAQQQQLIDSWVAKHSADHS
jgi:hypothetical protein